MRAIISATAFAVMTTFSAASVAAEEGEKKWTGVVAVKETPTVKQMIEIMPDPAVYGMALLKGLEQGTPGIEPAPAKYCFIPYDEGEPIDEPFCITKADMLSEGPAKSGVYTFQGPAEYFRPGRAMCVKVPDNWPAVAALERFPKTGGHLQPCRDFGEEAAAPDFAALKETAAMVIIIQPADIIGQ